MNTFWELQSAFLPWVLLAALPCVPVLERLAEGPEPCCLSDKAHPRADWVKSQHVYEAWWEVLTIAYALLIGRILA